MPHRKNRSRNRRSKRGPSRFSTSVSVSGKYIKNVGFSSSFSFTTFALEPSNIDRLASIGPNFEQYHFTHLKVRLLPSATTPVAIGYVDGPNETTPSGWNLASVLEVNNSQVWWPGQSMPVSFTVRKGGLNRTYKNLPVNNALGPTGTIFIGSAGGVTVTAYLEIDYTCVFVQPTYTGYETRRVNDNGTPDIVLVPSPSFEDESDEKGSEPFLGRNSRLIPPDRPSRIMSSSTIPSVIPPPTETKQLVSGGSNSHPNLMTSYQDYLAFVRARQNESSNMSPNPTAVAQPKVVEHVASGQLPKSAGANP